MGNFKRNKDINFSDHSKFVFDQDTLENYVACFTPKNQIPIALGCSGADLDRFCRVCYGCDWNEAFLNLSGLAETTARTAIKQLAFSGNQTALKIFTEHLMKLDREEQANTLRVQIVSDVPPTSSDDNADTSKIK